MALSFMDYYNANQRSGGAPAAGAPLQIPTNLRTGTFTGKTPEEENPFLGVGKWLLDIIDRPRNAVANVAKNAIDRGVAAGEDFASGDVGGGLANTLGAIFGSAPAAVQGLTSTNPADKHSTSDLIEYGTDTIGKATDPRYVDKEHNVDAPAKGILGFVGDVGLDPLTYVPATWLVKGAKMGVGAVDQGLTSLSRAAVGLPPLARAEKGAVQALEVGEDVAKATPTPKAAPKEFDADDYLAAGGFSPAPTGRASSEIAEALAEPAARAARPTPSERSFMDFATPSPAPRPVDASVPRVEFPEKQVPQQITMDDLVTASPGREPVQSVIDDITAPPEAQAVPETPREWSATVPDTYKIVPYGGGEPMAMAEFRVLSQQMGQAGAAIQAGDKTAAATFGALKQRLAPYASRLKEDHQKALSVPSGGTPQESFVSMLDRDRTAVENALGPELTDFLSRGHTPAKFDKLVQDIGSVVNLTGDTAEVLRRTDRNLSNLLADRLGTPRVATPNTPEEAAEAVQRALSKDTDYQAGISSTVQSVIAKELDEGAYPFRLTSDGLVVGRTTLHKGEGTGRYFEQFNTFTQMSISRKLFPLIERASKVSAEARGSKSGGFQTLQGKVRTEQFKAAKLQALGDAAQQLDQLGLSVVIGYGSRTSMLSFSEVYRGLLAAAEERGAVQMTDLALFNQGTEVLETHLMTAVNEAIHGASRDEVLDIITSTRKLGAKGSLSGSKGATANHLSQPSKSWAYTSRSAAVDAAARDLRISRTEADKYVRRGDAGRKSSTTGNKRKQAVYYVNYYQGGENRLAEELADTIMDAAAPLKVRAAENEASYLSRAAGETHELSTTVLQGIEETLAAPTGIVLKTDALKNWKKAPVEDGARIAASPDGVVGAQALVETGMGKTLTDDIEALRSAQSAPDLVTAATRNGDEIWSSVKTEKGTKPVDAPDEDFPSVQDRPSPSPDLFNDPKIQELFSEQGVESLGKVLRKDPRGDLSLDADKMVDAFGQRIQDPYSILKHKTRTWFDQNYRAANVHPIFSRWQNSMAMRSSYRNSQLNAISAASKRAGDVDGSLLQTAFANVQKGVTSSNPQSAQLEQMISGVLGDFFDLDATGSLGNSFLRVSGKTDVVNAMLAQKGIKQEFSIEDATVQGVLDMDALATQWKQWDIEDPLDFMHRMNLAREELAINAGVARSFIQLAKDTGAYSDVPAAGYVRVTSSGKSRFASHIPEDTYVKKELFSELQQVETVLRTSREFQGELGNFVRKYYGPALNAWKRTITIMRPGHHVRNYVGSTSATFVRRGANEFRRSHDDAFKVLMQKNNYRDVDMLSAAARDGYEGLPQGGDTLLSLGSRGDVKVDEVYAFMAEHGALPSFRVSEDFLPTEGGISSFMDMLSLSNTKVGKLAGGASEYTDHFTRVQHFMQALRQDAKKFPKRSKKKLMEDSLAETQKYHPDASMLTPMESKIRLAIPFYTWFSKMMPALVESMIMHPGRLSMFTKASYNAQVAAGIDPESLTDPFPDDQLFPSFIKENPMGPQMNWGGSYIRVNPGFAHLDVMNSFGADPFRGLLGMTSPLIRVPAEVISGGSWQTGGRIADTSDYIDQSIPFVNYLSNLTGYSTTGSLAGLLGGQGLDPQKGYQEKADGTTNKTELDQGLTALNWLTGMGFQNLSRPSYVNYAEIEKRNQAGEK